MPGITRRKLRTIAALCVAVGVLLLIPSCSGGCSRQEDKTDWTPPSEVTADEILDQPVPFDAQAVDETAALVSADAELSHAEIARAIVTAEAAARHLNQLLEQLSRNDDDADTWNVINELDSLSWPKNIVTILAGLGRQSLDTTENERIAALIETLEKQSATINELGRRVKNLPPVFQLDR